MTSKGIEATLNEWITHPYVVYPLTAIDSLPIEYSTEDIREAQRVLTACCMALDWPNGHPADIKAMLTGLENQGCRLDFVLEAINAADAGELTEIQRAEMRGAYRMAQAFLFDIESRS